MNLPNQLQPPHGWITPLIGKLVTWISWPSQRVLGDRDYAKQSSREPGAVYARARRVDTYVALWLAFCGIALCLSLRIATFNFWSLTLLIPVTWRILEIVSNALQVSVIDRLSVPRGDRPFVASHERIVMLGFANYLELMLCFASIYAVFPNAIQASHHWLDAVHLSAVSQLTIGYGDVAPLGWLRPVTWLQGMCSLALLVLLVGRFVSLMSAERSIAESSGNEDDNP